MDQDACLIRHERIQLLNTKNTLPAGDMDDYQVHCFLP
jgi:hypothetical protein